MPSMENAHGLVVGIANYQNINPLPGTVVKDAQDVYDLLIDPNHCCYGPENVELLLDEAATGATLRQGLSNLANRTNDDSSVFFYISSHGGRIESGPYQGEYLLPVDTVFTSDESLAATAVSGAEFAEALKAIPARKIVVVFDCCHSGGIPQPKDAAATVMKTGLSENYYDVLKTGRGRVILASSRSNEYSYVLPGASNSLFTQHLLDGLRGGVSGPGGVIRVFDIFDYLQPRVTAAQPNQHPIFKAEVEENFPIALYLGGKAPVPSPVAPPADEFAYDVFISYRHQERDKTWVRKTLVSRLKAEGLRVCVDYQSFRLGEMLVKEMERAVVQSRYTLAILSPAYLASNFTELEKTLAEHLGLEKGQRRFLAVMREPCTPSLRIRARLMLDMSDDDEFETDFARLVYELRQSPST